MTLKRVALRNLAIAALKGATPAQARVYSPADLASASEELPLIIVRSPTERKDSLGRNGPPQFNTVATMTVAMQLQAATQELAEIALENAAEKIEKALINNYDLTLQIQQFLFVETRMDINADGAVHLGQLTMAFGLEFYQGPEDFAPIETDQLKQVVIDGDMAAPVDKQGIYEIPQFPEAVTSPTRTSGPDGRREVGANITLPE
jgi:hypothetical protein